jgi:predicted dienelactone hydrolase
MHNYFANNSKRRIGVKLINKITALTVLIFAVLFFLFLGARARQDKVEVISADQFESLPYAEDGLYQVGIKSPDIENDNSLANTIWYPANNGFIAQEFTYSYEVKLGKPLGTVSIASFVGQATINAPFDLSDAPYPLVILSPGFSIGSTAYAWLAEHLASHGFVVISPDHNEKLDPENELWRSAITRPQDILDVLSYVEEELEAEGALQGLIDINSVAVIGHSYGGYTALAAGGAQIDTESFQATCQEVQGTEQPGAWLCEMLLPKMVEMAELAGLDEVPDSLWSSWGDERVKAIIPIAGDAFFFGQPGLSQITVPVLAIGGTADLDSPYLWGTHPSFEYSAGPRKAEVAFIDAEHMIFTGQCESIRWYLSFLSGEFCSDTNWDRSYAHEITKHFATAFLLAELEGDEEALRILAPGFVTLDSIQYESYGY